MEIMMAGPMIRRLLDGTKTQTRRTGARWTKVKPGNVLHVREAFAQLLEVMRSPEVIDEWTPVGGEP